MAFGKRTPGDAPKHPDAAPDVAHAPAPMAPVRTRVANHGDLDRKFIGIAIGVVVLSGGAAIAAPSLFSIMSGDAVRPIEQVIAGLDRSAMEQALAREAFPDESGRAFMTSLAASFPDEHGRLVDRLADAAAAGEDRDGLLLAMNAWSAEFAADQMPAISRTGAEGFDRTVSILSDGLRIAESKADVCTFAAIQRIAVDPQALEGFTSYGGEGYRLSMRASQSLVDLASRGRNAPVIDATLTQNDMNALQSTFISLMMDDQVMSLVQSAAASSNGPDINFADLDINICQLGRNILLKLDTLPETTKARLWATATSGDAASALGAYGLASPFGADPSMSALTFR